MRATRGTRFDKISERLFKVPTVPLGCEVAMPSQRPAKNQAPSAGVREKIHEIVFEADTPAGMAFDVSLLLVIVLSVIVICLDTVDNDSMEPWKGTLRVLHWCFTLLFTIEYVVRVACVRRPQRYIFSFWGIVDLLSFLPDYLLLAPGLPRTNAFSVIRSLRLLRVFRIFNLGWFQAEADELGGAIWRARAKIIVFLTSVLIIVTVTGTMMYEIEDAFAGENPGEESLFKSIPEGIYWAIVTMTTVGFGDIVPRSVPGKFLSSCLIMLGYSLIIVPTGLVSAEIIESKRKTMWSRACPSCMSEGHDQDAKHCKFCGEEL